MSSGADSNGAPPSSAGGEQKYYFCHQCNRTISLIQPSELLCPRCNGGFLEEVDLPSPPPLPAIPHFPFLSSDFVPFDPVDFSALFGGAAASRTSSAPSPSLDVGAVFDPLTFLHNYIHSMRSGGANIQFVIENSGDGVGGAGGGIRLPASNLGDYFFGPGLEQLIQQLAENDPNRYGTPPAAKTAVEGLPSVDVTEEMMNSDSSQCAVCMDEFELGAQAKQMPCKHVYHKDCIVPWLELHNSCPVCRYELPTDDPEYEQRSRGGGGGDTAGGETSRGEGEQASESGGDVNERVTERRFQISLPWPFLLSGDGNSSGGQNPNFGSETRQEHLD